MNCKESYPSSIINNLGVGIYIIDNKMNINWLNKEIKSWFIGAKEDFLSQKCYKTIFSRELPCNNCPALKDLENNKLGISNIQVSSLKGNKRQYRFQAKNFEHEQKIIMVMDITDQYQSEKMREDFIATLAHDLRTPLLAESRTLELLTKGVFGNLNDKQTEVLTAILVSNKDLLSMVQNLLEVYRYEAGAKALSSQTFDIAQLIDDCVFELTALAETKNIKIHYSPPEILPLILADKREIWRVLTNLIANAIEYTQDDGNISISISLEQDDIIVKVSDNGRGIPLTDIENLFERFSQGTSENISSGVGLGLYLSKQIIQAHNGKIWAKSEINKGSHFYFSLPVNV